MSQAANVAAIAEFKPDYLGFIFYRKSPRAISEVSAELIRFVPDAIQTIGVFVDEDLEEVKKYIYRYNLKGVQLHGQESVDYCEALKATGVSVIKAFGISSDFDFNILKAYEPVVTYFLFDTQTHVHGGSGVTFDWQLLSGYQLTKPYFLSGGIELRHAEAIKNINDPRLHAIDVNSKFEIGPGLKDVEKIKQLFKALQ